MVDCMLTKRGMRTAHFPQTATALTPRRNATGPLHACTRGAGDRSCTGEYDAYDFASDVPVPQVAQLLLDTHTAAQVAAVLTLRDPWGWAMSRVNGHSQSNKSESLRLTDDFSYVSVPCGCAWRPADRAPRARTVERRYGADPDTARRMAARATLDGDSGVLLDTYTAPGCAPPPLARHTAAALDLLTHNAWTFCVARRRRVPLFAANLAEDMFLTQGVPGRDDAAARCSRSAPRGSTRSSMRSARSSTRRPAAPPRSRRVRRSSGARTTTCSRRCSRGGWRPPSPRRGPS